MIGIGFSKTEQKNIYLRHLAKSGSIRRFSSHTTRRRLFKITPKALTISADIINKSHIDAPTHPTTIYEAYLIAVPVVDGYFLSKEKRTGFRTIWVGRPQKHRVSIRRRANILVDSMIVERHFPHWLT
jgi:hypothetical protein